MPKRTEYVNNTSAYYIIKNVFQKTFPMLSEPTSRNSGGDTWWVFDLTPLGFNNWKFEILEGNTYCGVALCNPNNARIESLGYRSSWGDSGLASCKARCTVLSDDSMDSIIVAISSNPAGFDSVPSENTMHTAAGFIIWFLAKDSDNGIFGGLVEDNKDTKKELSSGPILLIGETGAYNLNGSDLFSKRSNENDLDVLYLTSMPNWTVENKPLAKSMMMSVTIPKDEEKNNLKFGTYYSIGGKQYGNLSPTNPLARSPLIDPWCPY